MKIYGVVMFHDKDLTNFDYAQYAEKLHVHHFRWVLR